MSIRCFFLEPTGRWTDWQQVGEHGKRRSPIYRRSDTGEELALNDAPVGAMWYADWYLSEDGERKHHLIQPGPDGHVLVVRTPGGDWCVDSRASNCTMPDDDEHHCWVRHGEPPNITVDKNGHTCRAGAGSIAVGDYHGFLRDGHLT